MKKGLIITAAILTALGIALFLGALIIVGFDFSKLSAEKYETNTYTADGEFQSIDIEAKTIDIKFKQSSDGKCSVECYENENRKHTVKVENGTLIIRTDDNDKSWFERFSFFSKPQTMTVFLPGDSYEKLTVSCGTGDLTVPSSLSFDSAEITVSTGDLDFDATVRGKLKVVTSTGDVTLSDMEANEILLSTSTGHITGKSVKCAGELSISVSTGKINLTDVTCKNFTTTGSTGDVTLKNVVASERFSIERSTGDVRFDRSDAAEIYVKTSTGDVSGTFASDKIFFVETSTGDVDVPHNTSGGKCEIKTSTGDVEFR